MKAIFSWRLSFALLAHIFLVSRVIAGDISPYVPLNQSPAIERQIERLMVLADMPVLLKPFRVSDVQRAIEKSCDSEAPGKICREVTTYLSRYQEDLRITQASASISYADDDEIENGKFLPNQRGITTDSNFQVAANAQSQWGGHFIANVGGILYDDEFLPTAYISTGWDFAQIDVGWRDFWYSPFQDSAMLYSTNARVSPSVAVSNSRPLTGWNFRYEAFVTQLEKTDGILFQGERSPGRPYVAGLHLGFNPLPGWSIGLNRILQYGGDGRDSSLRTLLDGFFDPAGNDNSFGADNPDDEPGNQISSITTRFNFTGTVPFSVYLEYAGEDTSTGENYRLGNVAVSAGLFFPMVTENLDLTYEFSDWQNAWYVNFIYANGYTNDGSVIGHWGGNERLFDNAVSAQIHTLKANWDLGSRSVLQTTYRTVKNGDYPRAQNAPADFDYVRGHELQLRYSFAFDRYHTGLDLYVGRTTLDNDFVNIGAFVEW